MNAARAPSRKSLRGWGVALAVASVVLPSLPLGPLFAQPPIPLAVLWAAYGWAAEQESGWRVPMALAVLGLLHDQLAGGPYGLFPLIYLAAYLLGRGAAVLMSAPNLVSLWGGFIVTIMFTIVIVVAVERLFVPIAVAPYIEAAIITAILFPLVRPLYMAGAPAASPGPRR
jgi:hypothetical protein